MPITPLKYYLMKLLKLKDNDPILEEIDNYLIRNEYDINYDKIINDQKNNIEPLVYLKNNDSLGFVSQFKDENIYYNLVESTFVMDQESPLLDFEIHKNIIIDKKGFDIILTACKGKHNEYEANLSCSLDDISGYITTPDKKYINLHFMALNSLHQEIKDEKLLLTFAMKELEKQLTNYIELDIEKENKINVRRIK